jgi:hypothetical protein
MKVRDLKVLLDRFDPNMEIDGPTLTALVVRHNNHLVLINDRHADRLAESAPHYYKKPW